MTLTLQDVRRIAQTVATARDRRLHVAGVLHAEGGSGYTELMLVNERSGIEPCVVVGVDRTNSESEFRAALEKQLLRPSGERHLSTRAFP
ncbi:MAG: hypothetical protein ACRD1V_05830 [Vicinamibacterales bacterium]